MGQCGNVTASLPVSYVQVFAGCGSAASFMVRCRAASHLSLRPVCVALTTVANNQAITMR